MPASWFYKSSTTSPCVFLVLMSFFESSALMLDTWVVNVAFYLASTMSEVLMKLLIIIDMKTVHS